MITEVQNEIEEQLNAHSLKLPEGENSTIEFYLQNHSSLKAIGNKIFKKFPTWLQSEFKDEKLELFRTFYLNFKRKVKFTDRPEFRYYSEAPHEFQNYFLIPEFIPHEDLTDGFLIRLMAININLKLSELSETEKMEIKMKTKYPDFHGLGIEPIFRVDRIYFFEKNWDKIEKELLSIVGVQNRFLIEVLKEPIECLGEVENMTLDDVMKKWEASNFYSSDFPFKFCYLSKGVIKYEAKFREETNSHLDRIVNETSDPNNLEQFFNELESQLFNNRNISYLDFLSTPLQTLVEEAGSFIDLKRIIKTKVISELKDEYSGYHDKKTISTSLEDLSLLGASMTAIGLFENNGQAFQFLSSHFSIRCPDKSTKSIKLNSLYVKLDSIRKQVSEREINRFFRKITNYLRDGGL